MTRSLFERFAEKVLIGDDCWEWQATILHDGYGQIRAHGKKACAHRVSYELFVAPIPADMKVLHRCDNPGCVKPSHLFLGTHADNAHDRDQKGRGARGEKHYRAKLCEQDVREIRTRLASGEPQCKIAEDYPVGTCMINFINTGRSWSWLQ